MNLYKTNSIVLNLDSFVGMEKNIYYHEYDENVTYGIEYYTDKGSKLIVFDSEEKRDQNYNDIFLQLQLLGG